ncbi:ATP-binding protein [Kitasatospora sp. NPDC057223]|uniref:ATP-binding protein n=1 Tax=Kitasatospora sp. NPDC057223 TaxID=3346055 RepID=UPI0036323CBF
MSSTDTPVWQYEVPTSGSKRLPPDPRYVEALSSQGYGFEAALTDLVDNSIDAGARDVVIHFLREGDQLVSLLVVDDGGGMDEAALDIAMTVGGRRDYEGAALGMFGTGLKSASLSHAESVTVVSRTKRSRAAGRRLTTNGFKDDFSCDIVDPTYCQNLIDRYDMLILFHGTVVRWDGVKDFPKHGGAGQTDRYLMRTLDKLGLHLGLHLHRFLERDDFNITIAIEDVSTGQTLFDFSVQPLDPFGYPVTGKAGFPRTFTADVNGIAPVEMVAHIWPARSNLPQYRAGGSLLDRQGLYFYRHDRLVQAGGWNRFRQAEQHLALARIAIDLPDAAADVFRLTVKKSGVEASPSFINALEHAHDTDEVEFGQYLKDSESVYRESRQRSVRERKPVIAPGKGIAPSVRSAINEELTFLQGEDPIELVWRTLDEDVFFQLDRAGHIIVLNSRYRPAITGGRRGSLNDAPMVKTMLYLLLHKVFESEVQGAREKDNLQLWQNILIAAARTELDRADQ